MIKKLAIQLDSKKILSFLNKSGIKSIDEDSQTIFISVPNEFVKTQVHKFFLTEIQEAIREIYNPHYKVSITIDPLFAPPIDIKHLIESKKDKTDSTAESSKNKKQIYEQHTDMLTQYFGVLFDKKYQFTNFVVGSNNEFAYTIMNNIVDHLGTAHNPFFLHGNV